MKGFAHSGEILGQSWGLENILLLWMEAGTLVLGDDRAWEGGMIFRPRRKIEPQIFLLLLSGRCSGRSTGRSRFLAMQRLLDLTDHRGHIEVTTQKAADFSRVFLGRLQHSRVVNVKNFEIRLLAQPGLCFFQVLLE